jgi:hypothetical protein
VILLSFGEQDAQDCSDSVQCIFLRILLNPDLLEFKLQAAQLEDSNPLQYLRIN